jgi:hypothetical protein
LPVPDGTWELSSKNIFTFENNYLTSITQQGISEGVPVSQEKSLYTYQQIAGQTFIQSVEYQTWNSSENEWTNEDRSTITVENGMLSEVLEEVWMNDQWELYERYTYEETGGDVVETTQMYDSSLEDWVNYEQYVYLDLTSPELYDRLIEFIDYVEDGRSFVVLEILPDYISYEWDDVEETWIPVERQITEVSSSLRNNATSANSITLQSYDEDSEEWAVFLEYITGSADNGNPVSFSLYIAEETVEGEAGALILVYAEDYNYDENNLLESILNYGNLFGNSYKQLNDELSLTGRVLLTWGGVSTSITPDEQPLSFRLNAAYPNPFNPSTVIPFQLASASDVQIQVFDMLGRRVATLIDEFKPAGNHTVRFEASGLSSGVYMIRFTAPGAQQTRSVSLIK